MAKIIGPSALVVAVGMTILGCDLQFGKQPPARTRPKPVTLESASFVELTPVADGGLYANAHRALWYVHGNKATRVAGLPEDLVLSEIVPTADGGAYLTSLRGIWHLRGAEATRVQEVQGTSRQDTEQPEKERWLWALVQREHSRRLSAEAAREACE